jgi:hypothetical protein
MWWLLILAPFAFAWLGKESPGSIWALFLGSFFLLTVLVINPAMGATLALGVIGLALLLLLITALPYLIGFVVGIAIFVLFFKGLEQLLR